MSRPKHHLEGILAFLILFLPVSIASVAQTGNVLCILVDDLGYGDLSWQGAEDLETPHIDAIAAGGMTLTHFYANCPVCSPSRAALLTGKFPDLVGVPGVIRQNEHNNWGYLDPAAVLLPRLLKKNGYHTAIIGKWHLGYETPNTPNDRGFDHFKGFLGDMMDDYWTHRRGGINWMRSNRDRIDPEGHATDLFTEWAVEYLKQRGEDGRPFFLYLAYNAPHFPIQPPAEYLQRVQEREPGISEKRAKNVAFIEHLDHGIGKVVSCLESEGLAEKTMVVFTSDNGGALWHAQSNGKLRGGKQQMYEGGIRVPAFIRWDGQIEPQTKETMPFMLMDLFPTICQVTGTEIPAGIDGISILPALTGNVQGSGNRFMCWVRREGGSYGGQAYYAARLGGYKILQNSAFEPMQLYRIDRDELEQEPLDPEAHEAFRELKQALQEHIRRSGAVPWQSGN